ncbi:class I SAM-dependent methyltransferase [Amycolatopsis thermophila]|uniref:SAM-dependent methyltransferase n=1 Tax=Amycolatopsis thermophila TaxID=206084 RepID=A0ABU0EYK1_9PSEU|nr:class I SAM-dependent methyltransferase [Amycolatopsis thermophila]MDQ0380386.1 SAM-dependent methyltransferase [Amycolatopsis thermophila]
MTTTETPYLLGSEPEELRRLEEQAAALAPATRAILALAGIRPGMRVLDLGTGAGDVAFEVARLVGPSGSVVGIDQSSKALRWAAGRCAEQGLTNVSFVHDDLHEMRPAGEVDAVVGRLVLLYAPDPAAVLRKYAGYVRPGGVVVSMEYEMSVAGLLPPTPFSERVAFWITESFRRSGLDPGLGARLGTVFAEAGLAGATVLGLQGYSAPGTLTGSRMAAGVLRTLLPVLTRTGLATTEDVGIETLGQRFFDEQVETGRMFRPPTLVGAWARVGES